MKNHHQKPFFGISPPFSDDRVCPVPGEPGRYLVASATEVLPWLVDLRNAPGEPRCACAIAHNRERARWECRHIAAAQEYAVGNRQGNVRQGNKTTPNSSAKTA